MSDPANPKDPSAAALPDSARLPHAPYYPVLTGQPALVTGANSGIGRAVALGLARAGADVVVNYVTHPESADEVVHEIEAMGRRAIAIQADVSKEDEVERMFAVAIAQFGTLHIVVSNAGLQRDSAFTEMTLDQWNTVIGVNLTGQFLCTRAAAREFKRRGVVSGVSQAAGKIICMSSVHQQIPWAGHANYAASKGGIMLLMKSIAQELAPHFIRVNSIAPGAIRTPINTSAWDTPSAYSDLMTLVPYKRIGEPDDIAQAAVWLASDAADYVTGATLFVDGGMTLYPEQGVATVNRLVIPAGRPVHLELTSATVMQAILVPRLAGQIAVMAGMRTQLNLQADQPGRFFGENTQFSGAGFQNEKFGVDAMDAAGFAHWLAEVRAQPNRLDGTEYEKLTRRSTLPHPLAYAAVQPDLFDRVVLLQQPSGHTLEVDKLPPRPLPMGTDLGMAHDHEKAQ